MPLRIGFVLRCAAPLLVLFVGSCTDCGAAAEDAFPYTARVSGTNVRVRSGPGKNYYVTQELQYADEVEIYRHDPGGWYAIRPPRGSYSWVAAKYVQLHEDDTATIVGQRVVARVGSQLNEARDVIQVRLDRGERVRVLKSQRLTDGATAQTWYRIAPPPGEFRWIFGKYIQKELPASLTVPSRRGGNLLVEKIEKEANRPRRATPERFDAQGVERLSSDGKTRATGPADEYDGAAYDRPVRQVGREQRVSDHRERVTGDEVTDVENHAGGWSGVTRPADDVIRPEPALITDGRQFNRPAPRAAQGSTRPVAAVSGDHRKQANELDLLLSSMVAEEPSRWDFTEMRAEVEDLLAAGETAIERGRARLLLKKIDRFDDIRRRYGAVRQLANDTRSRDRQLDTIAATRVDRLDAGEGRYDGQGRLTRVVSRKLGAPRYALLSRTGEVLSYVTPAPGVNLRPYVGQQVGLTGSRGYMTEYKRQHVTAQRIQVLDRTITR